MKLVVTGASGFLGAKLVEHALAANHEVLALCRPGSGARGSSHAKLTWHPCPLADVPADLLTGATALVHLASAGVSPRPVSWKEAFQVNVTDSLALVTRAVEIGVPKVVVSGSCLEYGRAAARFERIPADAPLDPEGPYAASKAAFSLALKALCHDVDADVSLLRPFPLFGEGQYAANFWPSLKSAALEGRDFPMSPGGQVRDYQEVSAAAAEFLRQCEQPIQPNRGLRVRNLGSGVPVTLADFATHWWHHWHAAGTLQLGALPYRKSDIMRLVPDLHEVML